MITIVVGRDFSVAPDVLFDELRHLERHVEWMADAESITFESDQREGVGTSFVCRTKIGPWATNDAMIVVEWRENAAITVEHRGLFTGRGTFVLTPVAVGTRLEWREEINFPPWLLGPIGANVARPLLRAVWSRNLRRLEERLATS